MHKCSTIYHYKKIMFELELGKLQKPNGNCPQCHKGDIIPSQTDETYWTCIAGSCCVGLPLYLDCSWGTHNRCFFCGYVPPV